MLLYVTLGTNNMNEARRFYDAVLPVLGYRRQRDSEEEIGYAADGDTRCRLWIVLPFNKRWATSGNGSMVAIEAPSMRFMRQPLPVAVSTRAPRVFALITPISMRPT
jgi:catechol 2,3-dioxygenase-like lactoylglutathione lyase family enzyme